MTFIEFQNQINAMLIIRDPYILKLLIATYAGNFIPGTNPFWLTIIASTGGGKSELLTPLNALTQWTYEIDNLTPRTLVSGQKGKRGQEFSLIKKLQQDGKRILLSKDFTTLLGKNPKDLDEIFGQLRMIYDGKLVASYGNGVHVEADELRFGYIAACTSFWYTQIGNYSAMGERFLVYEMIMADQSKVFRLIANRGSTDYRYKLKDLFKEYLTEVVEYAEDYKSLSFEPEFLDEIEPLIHLSRRAKTAMTRNYKGEIVMAHLTDGAGRVGDQILQYSQALRMINSMDGDDALTKTDMALLARLLFTTIPQARRNMLFTLAKHGGQAKLSDIKRAGTANVQALEDMQNENIGLLERSITMGISFWRIKEPEILQLLQKWRFVMEDSIIEYNDVDPEQQNNPYGQEQW